jgi:hypothetical protein
MKFTAYTTSTGQVLYSGTADDPSALVSDGVSIFEGDAFPAAGWVASNQFHPLPTQPSSNHRFDWTAKQWSDPRTLQGHKDAKWEEIKLARTAAIDAPLVTSYGTFDSGPADRTNITDAVLMAQTLAAMGQTVSISFTRADNTVATLNAAQMIEVGLTLGSKVQTAYATARTLRTTIESATTIAQVQDVTWPA